MPVGESLLYLQPVYLQSTSAAFPEFQKIVVASPTTIVWGDTLAEALNLLLERQGAASRPEADANPDAVARRIARSDRDPRARRAARRDLPTDVAGLIDYANTHFELAQAALRAGRLRDLRHGDGPGGDRPGRSGS